MCEFKGFTNEGLILRLVLMLCYENISSSVLCLVCIFDIGFRVCFGHLYLLKTDWFHEIIQFYVYDCLDLF